MIRNSRSINVAHRTMYTYMRSIMTVMTSHTHRSCWILYRRERDTRSDDACMYPLHRTQYIYILHASIVIILFWFLYNRAHRMSDDSGIYEYLNASHRFYLCELINRQGLRQLSPINSIRLDERMSIFCFKSIFSRSIESTTSRIDRRLITQFMPVSKAKQLSYSNFGTKKI